MKNILKVLRESLGLTQAEVAKDLDMPQATYNRHEAGGQPSLEQGFVYSQYYGCPVEEIFSLSPSKIPLPKPGEREEAMEISRRISIYKGQILREIREYSGRKQLGRPKAK